MTRPACWFLLLAAVSTAAACGGGSNSGLTCNAGAFYRDGKEFADCSQCPSSDCAFDANTTDVCTYPNGVQQCTASGTVTVHCGSEQATIDINDNVTSCAAASGGGGSSGSGGGAMPGSGKGGAGGSGGAAGAASQFANCTFPSIGLAPTVGAAPTSDNSADLTGATLGSVTFDQTTMRRTVPVTVQSGLAGLALGSAYLTTTDSSSETAYLTIPVTNSGSSYYCFIEANPLQYLSSAGASLGNPTTSFVNGSVGALSGGSYTDTCLAPGESGYLIDIQLGTDGAFFSDTASIQLTLSSSSTGTVPAASLVPQSYDIGTCSSLRALRVTSLDTGTLPSAVGSYGESLAPAIFLDAQALPAGWVYVENDQVATVLPGGTVSSFAIIASNPAVVRAQFFIDFSKPAAASAVTSDAVASKLQQVRSRKQDLGVRWRAAASRASTTHGPVRHERSWLSALRAPVPR